MFQMIRFARPPWWAAIAVLGALCLTPRASALNMLYDTQTTQTRNTERNVWDNIPRIDEKTETPGKTVVPPGEVDPPNSHMPEPATLVSGLVGTTLFGLFGWWARRRPGVAGPVRLAVKSAEC